MLRLPRARHNTQDLASQIWPRGKVRQQRTRLWGCRLFWVALGERALDQRLELVEIMDADTGVESV